MRQLQRELRKRRRAKQLAEQLLSTPARTEVNQNAAHAFDVLGDPVRRRILELLARGERTAGSLTEVITEEFGITQAGVSQHLRALREGGLVNVRIDGPRRIYSVDATPLQAIDIWMDQFREFWDQRLRALTSEIARGKAKRQRDRSSIID